MARVPKGSSVTLKGPGLNSFFAESMVRDNGPTKARAQSCGPMLEEVRKAIVMRRSAVLQQLETVTVGGVSCRALIEDLERERDQLRWAFGQLMDGRKSHELRAETGLPEEECARLWAIREEHWAEFLKDTRKGTEP